MEIFKESFLYLEDARCEAEEVARDLDGIVMRASVSCSTMPAPYDVEKWEGTVDAFYVYDEDKSIIGIYAYVKCMQQLQQKLPQFAFLDDYNGGESLLDGRNLLLHLKTGMLIEVVYRGDVRLGADAYFYPFTYTDKFGGIVRFVAYVHPSFYLDLEQLNSEEIMETLHASAEWFICFCQAEDNETDEEDNE